MQYKTQRHYISTRAGFGKPQHKPIPFPFLRSLQINPLSCLSRLTGDLEDGLGQALHVAGCDTSDGDTAVLGSVDGVLLGQSIHLLRLQTGEGEHADLAGDVRPVVFAAESLEVLAQEGAHLDDAVGHALDLTKPLLVQGGVVHDGRGDASTVDGWVRVEGTNEDLDLRLDALLLLGVLADEREGTDTLSIETLHILLVYHISIVSDIFRRTMFLAKDWHRAMLWPSLTK